MTIKQKINSEKFRAILKSNKVKKIAIFGSYAQGKAGLHSDMDFLVEFNNDADLFDQIGLKHDLQDFLKKDVDVVTKASLSKYIRNSVLKGAIDL